MPERMSLFAAMLLWAASAPATAVQQADPPRRTDVPAESTTTPQTPSEQDVGVKEAIRLAIEVLDRMGTRDESDLPEALFDQVSRYIEIVQRDDPTNPRLPYLYGRTYALAGRRGDAVDQLSRFVKTREGRNEWVAYRVLGDLFVEEFPRLAKANYEKAAALNASEPSVLFGLSMCAFKLGANEEAISKAEEALVADGRQTIRYISHLATLFRAVGRWDEALREAELALGLAKQEVQARPGALSPLLVLDAQYQLLLSILQARLAQAAPERSERPGPDTTRLAADYLRLAAFLRERARNTRMLSLHDVLSVIEAGVDKTAPNTPPALLEQYGVVQAEVGRTEAAIATFKKLLTVDADNAVATEWLRRLQPEPAGTDQPE